MKFQALYEDYYDPQMGGADIDRKVIEQQLEKYYDYVARGHNNPAYHVAKEQLDDFARELHDTDNVASLVRELTEIFNMLSEHGFPMGRARYPGPGIEWKKLVDQYLR